jgi:chromosome segregation ATPase
MDDRQFEQAHAELAALIERIHATQARLHHIENERDEVRSELHGLQLREHDLQHRIAAVRQYRQMLASATDDLKRELDGER